MPSSCIYYKTAAIARLFARKGRKKRGAPLKKKKGLYVENRNPNDALHLRKRSAMRQVVAVAVAVVVEVVADKKFLDERSRMGIAFLLMCASTPSFGMMC